jgi:NAD+ diphosphatase
VLSHRLPLSRSTLERHAELRADPTLLERLLKAPNTLVTVLRGDRVPVVRPPQDAGDAQDGAGDVPRLALFSPEEATRVLRLTDPQVSPVAAFLGRDTAQRNHVLLAVPAPVTDGGQPSQDTDLPVWTSLREVATGLDDLEIGLAVTGVALARWHASEGWCPACGGRSGVEQSGWTRRCTGCGRDRYPRTDPAAIMTVLDERDRLLLGRQGSWAPSRYSLLAGFAEPGECLEDTVRREVHEEAGIRVGRVEYRASQPWPFPRSLMIGFRAWATSTEIRVDGEELHHADWWSREELSADLRSGRVILPPRLSIANALIAEWLGEPLPAAAL